ncbi:mediator of RNA polymerase II transcription subunit 4-like [Teleopsis dalmanni]|uniref:mediator of RNA polymerase II transcription subunit 4-like n=1 Tax=Teleopsis dalmanni TaxID=139649 RepID=UPI0018CED836|nr:mediator of RNA polymerase II transcription subunit 4-like [Teleopsis dalmanni]XP_037949102.1 mediator of RNA polymerase II transcription subunit 4-like [Teleopsis dalmanni]
MARGLKVKMLQIIDDIELISKEIIEKLIKPQCTEESLKERSALVDLLLYKHKELQDCHDIALEQCEIQNEIDKINAEINEVQREIVKDSKKLMEVEAKLTNAVYDVQQCLKTYKEAKQRPIDTEEAIKFAYEIANSTKEHPYPSLTQMKAGFLGKSTKVSDMDLSAEKNSDSSSDSSSSGGL